MFVSPAHVRIVHVHSFVLNLLAYDKKWLPLKMVHNIQVKKKLRTGIFDHTFSACTNENFNVMRTGETGV